MRKSKLDYPHIKQEVVKRLAVGEKPKSISRDVGLSQSQVYRFARREDIRALIEQEHMKLMVHVPDAVKKVGSLVEGMGKAKDKDERRLCYEASREVLKIAGILPTATQSTFIQQVYRQQDNPFLSPFIQELMNEHEKKMQFSEQELQELEGEKDKEGNGNR